MLGDYRDPQLLHIDSDVIKSIICKINQYFDVKKELIYKSISKIRYIKSKGNLCISTLSRLAYFKE